MLLLAMLATFSVGMIYIVQNELRLADSDMENTQAYYAAAAAMEKMLVDVNLLYAGQTSPTVSAVQALGGDTYKPSLTGVTYSNYAVTMPNSGGVPDTEIRAVSAGPNQGLMANMSSITMDVTAVASGETVKLTRDVQLASIPMFQFSIFSEGDLVFFSNGLISMPFRIHANGNLFLTAGSTKELVFQSRLTAAGEVIRARLANGFNPATPGWNAAVKIPTAPDGCLGTLPACRSMTTAEGSKVAGPTSSDTDNWVAVSESTYNGMVLDGDTGAKRLSLDFVDGVVRPVELIRRPPSGESATSLLGSSRLYNQAQIRILISDTAAEHPGSAGIQLANVAPYYDGTNYGATDTAFGEGDDGADADYVRPAAVPSGTWPLIDGYLLVQSRQSDSSYANVTAEWMDLGIAVENPNAILRFQRFKDDDGDGIADNSIADSPADFSPLALYDTREGELRDTDLGIGNASCAIGGIMNIVELNVDNLDQWLVGTIGTTGTSTESTSQNGYLLYFSDRRGMVPNASSVITGEYGFEDFINPTTAAGTLDVTLSTGEDVNENGQLDAYGVGALGNAFGVANNDPTIRINCNTIGRKNRVTGPRHGLKLVDAELGDVPTKPDNTGGFAVASENIVYVQGHYNANVSGFGAPYAAAAIIADAASFLSKDWVDSASFQNPTHVDSRNADTTYYRVAVAAGKSLNWPNPAWASTDQDVGLDGGTHNFLRFLEDWGGKTFYYRGSLVSPFHSEYAVGTYKCCDSVYKAPTRDFTFDTDFLDPSKLPPATPGYEDVVSLGYRRVF